MNIRCWDRAVVGTLLRDVASVSLQQFDHVRELLNFHMCRDRFRGDQE